MGRQDRPGDGRSRDACSHRGEGIAHPRGNDRASERKDRHKDERQGEHRGEGKDEGARTRAPERQCDRGPSPARRRSEQGDHAAGTAAAVQRGNSHGDKYALIPSFPTNWWDFFVGEVGSEQATRAWNC